MVKDLILMEPFKTLWKRDKQGRKLKAEKDIWFVYRMYSRTEDNKYRYLPEEERYDALVKDIYGDDFKEDKTLEWALEKFKKMSQTIEDRLLDSASRATMQLIEYLETLDTKAPSFNSDMLLKVLSDITKAKGVYEQLRRIRESAERAAETKKSRGQQEVGLFEEPPMFDVSNREDTEDTE